MLLDCLNNRRLVLWFLPDLSKKAFWVIILESSVPKV